MITVNIIDSPTAIWRRDEAVIKTNWGYIRIVTQTFDYEDDTHDDCMWFLNPLDPYDREFIDFYEECLDDWKKNQLQTKLGE